MLATPASTTNVTATNTIEYIWIYADEKAKLYAQFKAHKSGNTQF